MSYIDAARKVNSTSNLSNNQNTSTQNNNQQTFKYINNPDGTPVNASVPVTTNTPTQNNVSVTPANVSQTK